MLIPNKVKQNSDLFVWKFSIVKASGLPCPSTVNIPDVAGVTILSVTSTKPGVNWSSNNVTWSNDFVSGEIAEVNVTYSVDDITQLPKSLTATISFDCDTLSSNNSLTETIDVEFCPPAAGANGGTGAVFGDLSSTDTKCSSCTTEWRLVEGSEINCTVELNANGHYNLTYDDFSNEASFQYNIWCINCVDGNDYETSGPATVTAPALSNTPPVPPVFYQQDFTGFTGLTNTVILDYTPAPGYSLIVTRNGLVLPQTYWSLFGTTITFVETIAEEEYISIFYFTYDTISPLS